VIAGPTVRASPRLDAWVGVSVLLLLAPFERLEPLLRLPGQQLSNVEAVLLAVLAGWALALLVRQDVAGPRTLALVRSPLAPPLVALVLVMLAAALMAPAPESLRVNALNMAGRYALALFVYLLAVDAAASGRLDRVLAVAVALGAALAALVLFDFAGSPGLRTWLMQFRTGIAGVGSQVRASGPFQYPTIASMYLELLFALGLGGLLLVLDQGRHRAAALVVAVLLVVGQAVVLTFTRAGLLALLASVAIVAALRFRERGVDRAVLVLAGIALAIGLQFVASRSLDALRLRMSSEGQAGWYRAAFKAPPEVEIAVGDRVAVPLSVTNTGRVTWQPDGSPRIRLSYHWLLADDDRVVSWEGLRTDFQAPVGPGDTVEVVARVEAPRRAGRYRLLWDLEEEHRLWFSTEPDATLFTSHATVTGPHAAPLDSESLRPFPKNAARPGRLVLWRAAGRMVADRPWTGVGPDNFRLLYGGYAGLADADERVHSNNLYLEILVSGGLVGGLVLIWIGWRLAMVSWRLVMPRAIHPAAPGLVAALAALAVHGMFDAFLAFTATYILTAITLGLAVGLSLPAASMSPGPRGPARAEGV
jgi:O-antigen ligase